MQRQTKEQIMGSDEVKAKFAEFNDSVRLQFKAKQD
jgi:hypothetical protein